MRVRLLAIVTTAVTLFSLVPLGAQRPSSQPILIEMDDFRLRQEVFFEENQQNQSIRLCQLVPGDDYTVWAVQPQGCSPSLEMAGGKKSGRTFSFVATDECMNFKLTRGADCDEGSAWFSISHDSGKPQGSPFEKLANLTVAGDFTDQYLVQEVFIGGGCFDVSGVSGVGPGDAKGVFGNGGASIFIEDGVILSSGSIYNAPGPNNSNSAGNNVGGGSGDPDLQLLAAGSLHDVVGIEFDFQPTISQINFDYVFASEEYCEFVNSSFNDVFGFFISGPGISGGFQFNGENIAVIPNSATPIAINNVNHLSNTGFFIGNQNNCNSTWNMTDIQFDGFTTLLTAVANVIPCETYHIRLMVSDVGDGIYDSAVFLRANSFSAGGTGTGEATAVTTGNNIIYESCNDGSLVFTRAGGDINMPLILDYTIDPSSTATAGVDYSPLSGQVVIPPGFDSWSVPINVFNDNIQEGVEFIIISVTNSCSCSSLAIEIEIHDPPPIDAQLPDYDLCEATPVLLEPVVNGGIPNNPYTYQWDPGGATSPILTVVPTANTTYTVTVTDACGATATAVSNITVTPIPTAIITGSGLLCPDDPDPSVDIQIDFTGVGPWSVEMLFNGVLQPTLVTDENPYVFTTGTAGTYQLQSVTSVVGGCVGVVAGIAPVVVSNLDVSATTTAASCVGDGTMTALPTGGSPPYSYTWSTGFPSVPTVIGLLPGTYSVTITDLDGCTAVTSATVDELPAMSATAEAVSGATCVDPLGGSINVDITGGTQPFTFTWTGGISNVQNPTGLAGGTYEVTITDGAGCLAVAEATVPENIALPTAVATAPEVINCISTNVDISGIGSSSGPNFTYQWTGPGITAGATSINAAVNLAGTYLLTVTDQSNGCSAIANVTVTADQTPPTAVAVGGELSCTTSQINLDGTSSIGGPNIEYAWSGPGILSGGNTPTPTVNAAGFYTLTVTNPDNGCTGSMQAEVTLDDDLPVASISNPVPLTCATTSVTLDGSSSSAGPNFTYEWYAGGTPIPGAGNPTVVVEDPGTYQILVTDLDNGCTSTYSVQVNEDLTQPAIDATADGEITCIITSVGVNGTVNGNAANYSFTWSTSNGSIIGGSNSASATVGAPGTYDLVVTSLGNGCSASTSVEVTQDASIPQVEITSTGDLDCITTQVQLDGGNSTQGPTLTYTWTTQGGNFVSGQNTLTPTVDAPGTYYLTIFDSSNNCESESSVTVAEDVLAPEITMPATPVLDCDVTSLTLEASVANGTGLQFEWNSLDGLIDGASDILTPLTSTPGTYTLTVTNPANGCTDEASITVDENVTPPTAQVETPDELTCSTNTVTLNGGGSSSGANFVYQWTTTNGNLVNGANTLSPVVDAPGTYNLLITNNLNGCTQTAQSIVNEDVETPDADAGQPATLTCAVEELTLGGSGSTGSQFAYEWTGPGITSGGNTLSPVVNTPGTYQLLVTNLTNECTATASVAIGQDIVQPAAEAGIGGELSCTVTQMTLEGLGSSAGNNFTYEWTSPDGNIMSGETTLNPVINAPGFYNIVVTNTANGCTAADQVEITEDDDLPEVDAGTASPLTCLVTEVSLDGSGSAAGPNFTYQWSSQNGNIVTGGNSLTPVVDAPGIYVLTVTNTATNCTNLGSVTVQAQTNPPIVEAGPTDELTCSETSLALNATGTASGSNFTYEWTTLDGNILSGNNSLNPMIDEPGTYLLLVTNTVTGCTASDQVSITQSLDSPLASAAAPVALTCDIEEVTLVTNGTSTGSNFIYEWTTADGNIVSGNTSLAPVVNQPGTYLLLVTNTTNGCTETAQAIVAQDIEAPVAEAGSADEITCTVTTVSLNGNGSSSGLDYTYNWSTINGNIVSGSTSLTPDVNQTGTYTLIVTNTTNGCTAADQVVVNQDDSVPQAVITPPGELNCLVTEITLNASASQGADFEYLWTTSGGYIVAGETTLNPEINAPGIYLLTVTNSSNGCTKEAQVTVDQDIETPVADAGEAFVMDCFDEINYLDGSGSTGNGALTFQWEVIDGNLASGATTAQPGIDAPGTYLLIVTNAANGCTDSDQVTVTRDGPAVEPETLQPLCYGDRGLINLSGTSGGELPYLYSINGGNSFATDAVYPNLPSGVYEIIVQDAKGCEFETEVMIEQPNQFNVELDPQVELKLGDSYQINTLVNFPIDEIAQVTWFPSNTLSCEDCLNPIASPVTTTLYKVTVVTKNGCEDSAPILFRVDKRGGVYVPNAFSPNGDGSNDVFMIFSDQESVAKVKSFLVFNRWGETVHEYFNFSPNDPSFGWDGTHRGEPSNPAVYAWFAVVEFIDGRTEVFEGDVTLMK